MLAELQRASRHQNGVSNLGSTSYKGGGISHSSDGGDTSDGGGK